MSSNNAVILLKAQTYGDIKEGETMKFEKRPYSFDELKGGEVIVKAMYLSIDPYLVSTPVIRFPPRPPSTFPYVFVSLVILYLVVGFILLFLCFICCAS